MSAIVHHHLLIGVVFPTSSTVGESGQIVSRVAIARPVEVARMPVADFQNSHWEKASREVWQVLNLSQTELRPGEIYRLIMDDHKNHQLSAGIYLKRSSVMDDWRIEVVGSLSDGLIRQLAADGCFTEIVNWRKRVFIPTGEDAALPVIERVRDTVRGY